MRSKYIQFLLIFLGSFLLAFCLQYFRWQGPNVLDKGMWANQAEYVALHDPREFDALAAYGHPGGPIIDGTITLHRFFHVSYTAALTTCLTLLMSLVIAAITTLLYAIRKNILWTITAFSMVAVNQFYVTATPPSALAAVFVPLLVLLTLTIYERKDALPDWFFVLWAAVLGFTVATRADIGVFVGLFVTILVYMSIPIKKLLLMVGGAFLTFVIFDPFMRFMPVQHIFDLVHKMVYHYADFPTAHLERMIVFEISVLALTAMVLALGSLRFKHKTPPLPKQFIVVLSLLTVIVYAIFLSAHYKAPRYFLPIIFTWHVLLPGIVLWYIPMTKLSFLKTEAAKEKGRQALRVALGVFLVGYGIAFVLYSVLLDRLFTL